MTEKSGKLTRAEKNTICKYFKKIINNKNNMGNLELTIIAAGAIIIVLLIVFFTKKKSFQEGGKKTDEDNVNRLREEFSSIINSKDQTIQALNENIIELQKKRTTTKSVYSGK